MHTLDACTSLTGEKLPERRIGRPQEVAEHVDVAAVFDGGDLDPGNGFDAALGRRARARLRRTRSYRGPVTAITERPAPAACSTSSNGLQRPSDAVV
jgi:hypothetical protein